MLELKKINKSYQTGDFVQQALKNVSIEFKKNEFVAILGPSGSGKTTLLNIIGGLDRYDTGDLIINQKSTKDFKDRDWDAYRNNCIGFVFQSYNLIGHIDILQNVEMGMTLSGVSSKERKKRAIEVLTRVGLKDHLHKKPNQLSGGQMQRVAIARALANDPDIILADEPTGALDSKTSVQIMNLIQEIAKDKLVIMVTHNPELAHEYASRVIEMKDGEVVSDSRKGTSVKITNLFYNTPARLKYLKSDQSELASCVSFVERLADNYAAQAHPVEFYYIVYGTDPAADSYVYFRELPLQLFIKFERRTLEHSVLRYVGTYDLSESISLELFYKGSGRDFGRFQPSVRGNESVLHIRSEDYLSCSEFCEPLPEVIRFGYSHAPAYGSVRPAVENRFQGIGAFDPAAVLNIHPGTGGNFLEHCEILWGGSLGAVEIDEMQPADTRIAESHSHLRRVFEIACFTVVIALRQPHTLPADYIYRWYYLYHKSAYAKKVIESGYRQYSPLFALIAARITNTIHKIPKTISNGMPMITKHKTSATIE